MMQEARMPSLKDKIVAEPKVSKKKFGGEGRATKSNKEIKNKDGKKK